MQFFTINSLLNVTIYSILFKEYNNEKIIVSHVATW